MIRRLLTLLLIASSAISFAQEKITLPDDLDEKVKAIFKDWDREDGPGGVIGVMVGDELLYQKAFGLANIEHSVANTVTTRFDVGSNSKQFTSMCILLLEEDGLLSIDDLASKHLEGFTILDNNPITIRNLMSHTSGIRDFFAIMNLSQISLWNQDKILEYFKKQQTLNFETNTRYMYTNTAFVMLAEIIEKISKKSFAAFAEERIFQPLGMTNSGFKDNVAHVIPNFADSYRPLGKNWQRAHNPNAVAGPGGLVTNIEDMAKWVANFKDNKLGKGDQELIDKMQEAVLLNSGSSAGYGFGIAINSLSGVRAFDHTGGWEGYRSRLTRFPDHELAVMVFGNEGTNSPITKSNQVALHILKDHLVNNNSKPTEKPEEFEMDEDQLKQYAGSYQLDEKRLAVITQNSLGLHIQITGQPRNRIYPIAPDKIRFQNADITVDFSRNEEGEIEKATLTQNGTPHEMPLVEKFQPTEEYMSGLIGVYESSELQSTAKISVVQGRVLLELPTMGRRFLTFHLPDHVQVANVQYDFYRDEKGTVTEFRLSLSRAIEIRYVRVSRPPGTAN